jgi:hypothetical protein
MELVRGLSNPQLGVELGELRTVLAKLAKSAAANPVAVPRRALRQGEILSAINVVLIGEPSGLRTTEVHARVEEQLGRDISYSTVKANLAGGSRFERLARGVYRLKIEAR